MGLFSGKNIAQQTGAWLALCYKYRVLKCAVCVEPRVREHLASRYLNHSDKALLVHLKKKTTTYSKVTQIYHYIKFQCSARYCINSKDKWGVSLLLLIVWWFRFSLPFLCCCCCPSRAGIRNSAAFKYLKCACERIWILSASHIKLTIWNNLKFINYLCLCMAPP